MAVKRKRAPTPHPAVTSLVEGSFNGDDLRTNTGGTGSPRTQVASHLQRLEIEETPSPPSSPQVQGGHDMAVDSETDAPYKRRRRSETIVVSIVESEGWDEKAIPRTWKATLAHHNPRRRSRTPPARIRLPSTPPASSPVEVASAQPVESITIQSPHRRSPRTHGRLRSPPPATGRLSAPDTELCTTRKRSPSPLAHTPSSAAAAPEPLPPPARGEPSSLPGAEPGAEAAQEEPTMPLLDTTSLTWRPSEITGHEIDATQPDDADGLGINGIGFHPTPAMADQRRARRRAQVSQWRAREEREARQRRVERRSRGVRGVVGDGEGSSGASTSSGGGGEDGGWRGGEAPEIDTPGKNHGQGQAWDGSGANGFRTGERSFAPGRGRKRCVRFAVVSGSE